MAASEHAIGTDQAGPGVEALSCDELHRRDCHATFHLSDFSIVARSIFRQCFLLLARQAYHDNGALVKRGALRL